MRKKNKDIKTSIDCCPNDCDYFEFLLMENINYCAKYDIILRKGKIWFKRCEECIVKNFRKKPNTFKVRK